MNMPQPVSQPLIFHRSAPVCATGYMETVELMAREFSQLAGIVRTEAVLASALHREAEDPTCVGRQLAVPHARVAGLSCVGIYIARMEQPVIWPNDPVRMVAFLAVPEETPEMYLQMLARLVRWWMRECTEYGDTVHMQPMQVLAESLAARMCPNC